MVNWMMMTTKIALLLLYPLSDLAAALLPLQKTTLPDLNLPPPEERPVQPVANQKTVVPNFLHNLSFDEKQDDHSDSNKEIKRLKNKRASWRKSSKVYKNKFSKKSYDEAKLTLSAEKFSKYEELFTKFQLLQNRSRKDYLKKKRERSERIRKGKGTLEDHLYKIQDKQDNRKQYLRRKMLGIKSPSQIKKKMRSE